VTPPRTFLFLRAKSGSAGEQAMRWILVAAIALHGAAVHAELWGYIDEQGVAHFAATQIDARYELFFKGRSSLDRAPADAIEREARAALERSSLYRLVSDHPNLRRFAPLIEQQARAQALDPALVKAVIAVESAFEPSAVSPKGALGLMQVMQETGVRYGLVDDRRGTVAQKLFDPAINVRVGARYLRDLLATFGNDLTLALAAYNSGEQSVRQWGNRVPPFAETRAYVDMVQQFQSLYRPPQQETTAASSRLRLELPARKSRAPVASNP
jgi:soluble lytic murein transglycosylase-like protein